ncbi:MAG: hypothetical protein H6747_14720 [Deltaproteobacteria bacterium]|nr:hypothetical protein [Deltaproteobacteria bacterium]
MTRMLLLFHPRDHNAALQAARSLVACGVTVRGLGPVAEPGALQDLDFEDDTRRVAAAAAVVVLHTENASRDFRLQHAVAAAEGARVPIGVLSTRGTIARPPAHAALLVDPENAPHDAWRQLVAALLSPPQIDVSTAFAASELLPADRAPLRVAEDPELAVLRRIEAGLRDRRVARADTIAMTPEALAAAESAPVYVHARAGRQQLASFAAAGALVALIAVAAGGWLRSAAPSSEMAMRADAALAAPTAAAPSDDLALESAAILAAAPNVASPPQVPPPPSTHVSPYDAIEAFDGTAQTEPTAAPRKAPQPAAAPAVEKEVEESDAPAVAPRRARRSKIAAALTGAPSLREAIDLDRPVAEPLLR